MLQRRGIERRGLAAGTAFLLVILVIAGIGSAVHPDARRQREQVRRRGARATSTTSRRARGRFGFLETKYHVVEKVREQIKNGGAKKLLGLSGAAVSVTKGVVNIVVGIVTIVFLTFFMLLEGPAWVERFYCAPAAGDAAALAKGRARHLPARSAATSRATC